MNLKNYEMKKKLPIVSVSIFALIGPAFVWSSVAQGSGELIWWPYLVSKYGLAFIGLLIPACVIQFFVNDEIIRYTALTGRGIWSGFSKIGKWYSVPLFLLCFVSMLWFGAYARGGGTALYELTQFPKSLFGYEISTKGGSLFWGYVLIAIFSFGFFSFSRVYKLLELFMKIIAVVTVVGLFFAVFQKDVFKVAAEYFTALLNPFSFHFPENWQKEDASKLITAIVFAGLGGFFSLMYSYWMKDKKIAMALYNNTVDKKKQSKKETDFYFEDNLENKKNWQFWKKYLLLDNGIGVLINLVTVIITCLLAFSILYPKGVFPAGWKIAVVQADFFRESMGAVGGIIFLIIAAAFLGDTWFGVADGASRKFADFTLSHFKNANQKSYFFWYYIWLIFIIVVTCCTIGIAAPGTLMQIGGVIGIFAFVLYIPALYYLNYFYLPKKFPKWIAPPLWRQILLLLIWLFYTSFAVFFVGTMV